MESQRAHFDSVEVLLKDTDSPFWRRRPSSSSALASLDSLEACNANILGFQLPKLIMFNQLCGDRKTPKCEHQRISAMPVSLPRDSALNHVAEVQRMQVYQPQIQAIPRHRMLIDASCAALSNLVWSFGLFSVRFFPLFAYTICSHPQCKRD